MIQDIKPYSLENKYSPRPSKNEPNFGSFFIAIHAPHMKHDRIVEVAQANNDR